MDPLTYFLDGPRAAGAFALAIEMVPPWGIEVRDAAAMTLITITSGTATVDGVILTAGDIALVRGPEPYTVADPGAPEVSAIIHPGQRCTSVGGSDLQYEFRRGVRRWGNTVDGTTSLLIGTYEREGAIGSFVSRALPRLVVVRAANADPLLVALLEREISRDEVGQQIVIDRLFDLLVVAVVRSWLREQTDPEKSWLTVTDPLIGDALRLLHQAPAEPWTVDALARRLHVSRATFAARFRRAVGRGPITYLTEWRMTIASEQLLDPAASVASVASAVGYENPFAFSVAFKRWAGISPSIHRTSPALV